MYADPPWQYNDRGVRGGTDHHYGTAEINTLEAIPVWDLAAREAVLFMWGVYPLLPEMLALGKAWGFEYKTIAFQWVKRYEKSMTPFWGTGRWTRSNTEGCFLFLRGKPKRVSAGVHQVIETFDMELLDAPVSKHSAKPAIVRNRIMELMGDQPAVELFARERAEGWECWGDQADSTLSLL